MSATVLAEATVNTAVEHSSQLFSRSYTFRGLHPGVGMAAHWAGLGLLESCVTLKNEANELPLRPRVPTRALGAVVQDRSSFSRTHLSATLRLLDTGAPQLGQFCAPGDLWL